MKKITLRFIVFILGCFLLSTVIPVFGAAVVVPWKSGNFLVIKLPAPEPDASFTPGLTWYWQLAGTVNKQHDVDVYNIDLEDNASSGLFAELKDKGIKLVCYFSAGTYEEWRQDANLFTSDILGKNLDDWPGEKWVDIRKEKTRSIMAQRMDRAASAGCDAVEPDNIDGYQNDNGLGLTAADQLDYLSWLADYAHSKGLKIALKNTLDLIQSGKLYEHFDFAINEECYSYNECDVLKAFIEVNKAVFIAQYKGDKNTLCPLAIQNNYFLAFFNQDLDGQTYIPCIR
ncbi:MAG: endo alpha-1,4 polygalactosaminidase [Candidatus Electrothrix sp. AW5]|nr:endo alpha-1,4 polygalactosaminidase [Candidatus Electrothrix gigas]